MPLLTPRAEKLILDFEVGGGQAYYNKKLLRPTWPGGASGVTIGVGYDLGYNTSAQFTTDWGTRLARPEFTRLAACLGKKGQPAKALIAGVHDIQVLWPAASAVFFALTVPRFYRQALGAFPGMDKLPADAQGALISLVFNRGGSLKGKSRVEMKAIHDLVPRGDLKGIAAQLRLMKRLWIGKGLDGLLKRRDEEAKLVESAIGTAAVAPVNPVATPTNPIAAPISPTSAPINPFSAS
jgi:hypothetical protein